MTAQGKAAAKARAKAKTTANADAERGYEEAATRNARGLQLKASGDYAAAREQYEAAMRLVGPADTDIAATLLHNLAGIRFVLDDVAGAARCGRRGLAMRRRLRPPDDVAVLLDEANLAPILMSLGDFDQAGRMLELLLARFTVQFGPSDLEVAVTLTNLGALAAYRGDWTGDRDHLARAGRIKSDRLGATSPDLVGTLVSLAVVHDRLGDPDVARAVLDRARLIASTTMPTTHPLYRHIEHLAAATDNERQRRSGGASRPTSSP